LALRPSGWRSSSLRVGLALMVMTAAADTMFAILGGADTALVIDGALITIAALAGILQPERVASLLCPPGRIVIAAGLFVGLGALQPGLQTHYADTEMAIAWLAAIVASPRWVLACVAVCVAGAIGDQAAAGHSLQWMLHGAGKDTLFNEIIDLCTSAALVFAAVSLLRRSIAGAPASLAAARSGGPSLTPQLASAVRREPVGLLPRADPAALIEPLTAAERRILALLADGLAPKQAAHRLGVALPTVRSHISAAKRKTGARTLEQLVGLYSEANGDG